MMLLLLFVACSSAYNLAPETGNPIRDPYFPQKSYFGYTVALRRDPARLIVGAPRSKSSKSEYRFITEPGAVFTFDLNTGAYKELTLENAGERQRPDLGYYDFKNNAWIGGALDVSDHSNRLTVCGSRWVNQIHADYRLMNGVCYVVADDLSANTEGIKLIPLLNKTKQAYVYQSVEHFLYAYGQAGFSVHMTPDEEILMGAPGIFRWDGSVVKYNSPILENPLVPNPSFTGKLLFKDGYFGYVVSSGKFTTVNRLYVASAPRAAGYRGQVLIYRFPENENASFQIHLTLEGSQIGEYFGASLGVVDFDNDGLDDLLVGAPLLSTERFGDVGGVYVYRNSDLWNLKDPLKISGSNVPGARFGTAIGGFVDFDNDGFNDVVIGSPYEDKGAVYVYRGSSRGLAPVYSQRIAAREFGLLDGFGFSISRGLDVDGNSYPDIAVGAYESGHAVVIKTKPVTKLQVHLERNGRHINFNASQILLDACAVYDGQFLPNDLGITFTMTVDKLHRRALFLSGDSTSISSIRLIKGQERCKTYVLKIQPSSSWSDSARFAVFPIFLTGILQEACPLCPIIDPSSNSTALEKIQVMATCDKEECIPQWKISTDFFNIEKPFVVGSNKNVILRTSVWNEGDNAHILRVSVHLPPKLQPRSMPIFCTPTENILSCLPGLRIDTNETKSFDLNLDASDIDEGIVQVNVTAHAYDSQNVSQAEAILHAVRILRLGVTALAAPAIAAVPKNVTSSDVMRLVHSYQTFCAGFTPVPNVTFELITPLKVYYQNAWREIFNFSFSAFVGDRPIQCGSVSLQPSVRRNAESERALSCKGGSKDIECVKITCVGGTLMPSSDGLDFTLKMDLRLSVINWFLKKDSSVFLNTSALAVSEGTSLAPVSKGVATQLAGPVLEKDDPWLVYYIVFAVIVALALLLVIVLMCRKWGFFNRTEIPTDIADDAELILYSNTEKAQEAEQQPEGSTEMDAAVCKEIMAFG